MKGFWPFSLDVYFLTHQCYRGRLHYQTAAATAAKSLQSCPTLRDPIDGSPPGSPVPGILQTRTLEWVAIFFSNTWKWKVKVKSLSHVRPSATPRTAAFQALLSMGFARQEYWSGVPLPSPCYQTGWVQIPGSHFMDVFLFSKERKFPKYFSTTLVPYQVLNECIQSSCSYSFSMISLSLRT